MDTEYYILTRNYSEQFNAGNKVYDDNREILLNQGVKEIRIDLKSYRSYNFIIRKIFRLLEVLQNIKKIHQILHDDDVLIIQYPFYTPCFFTLLSFLTFIKCKKIKILLIIIDIDSLRMPNHCKYTKSDKRIIQKVSYIVSHNPIMTKYIREKFLYKGPIADINVFDYLIDVTYSSKNNEITRTLSNKIAFAGNLRKSDFIYKLGELNDNIIFNLYGKEVTNMNFPTCCHYSGCYFPGELPLKLNASFGLVWDGNSIETCSGNYGEYLRYNNPHKLSLYIASEMPVIVWKKSAVAEFVEKHNIGFTVYSLHEIKDRIINISDTEYSQMISNIKMLSKKISNGQMLIQSIKDVLHSN